MNAIIKEKSNKIVINVVTDFQKVAKKIFFLQKLNFNLILGVTY